jgi:glycosyltransferase involved in cell wall biosynthesis
VKILWVKPGKLLPLDTGGKLRTYNILHHLSAGHDVACLTYYGGPRDQEYEREIGQRLPGAVSVQTAAAEAVGVRRYFEYLRHLPQSAPYAVSRFISPRIQKQVADWISQRRFDVAVCDFLACAPNFPQHLATPTVLFQHNVESVLWKRRAEFAVSPLHRIISKVEYAKMLRYETAQVRRFHRVFAVSEDDRQAMARMTDISRISVIPTGVDLRRYRYDPEVRPVGPLVVFTGSMDWEPNIDGVEYFCREIWSHVLAEVPEAIFRIVGRDPHPRVRSLESASVEVTGTVPSVIEHVREAAVLVVPLRMGSGTRIKIYEGMAMGKAMVATSVGAEGLDVRHEHDIVLADEPARFAEYVVTLLRNENLRRQYEKAAAGTVRQYDWSAVTELLVKQLQKSIPSTSPDNVVSTPFMVA